MSRLSLLRLRGLLVAVRPTLTNESMSNMLHLAFMLNEPRFIGQSITVDFVQPPLLEKKPGCPDRFFWQGETFEIEAKLKEWHDYHRRGRMARNMKPTHAAVAEGRGSWGVGRDYFRVRTTDGRIFELYYDRAPIDVDHRKGSWFLIQELPPDSDKAD